MQRFKPLRRPGYRLDVVEPQHALDDDLELHLLGAPDRHLGLRDQHVDRIDIRRNAHLRDHDQVKPLARLLDDVDHVAIAPRRIKPVDAHGHRLGPEVHGLQAFDDVGPRLRLVGRRNTVLEVETDHVGIRSGRLLEQLRAHAGNEQLRPVEARADTVDGGEAHCNATPG